MTQPTSVTGRSRHPCHSAAELNVITASIFRRMAHRVPAAAPNKIVVTTDIDRHDCEVKRRDRINDRGRCLGCRCWCGAVGPRHLYWLCVLPTEAS